MATYLVTGASSGIGLELCRQVHQRGDQVIAACRTISDELKALDVQVEPDVDIASEQAIADLAKRLKGVTLDVLINNAGIWRNSSLSDLNWEGIREQFEVNALGALRVTLALLPNLSNSAKVILITSRMGSIEDNTSGGSYGYRMSKVALSMAGKSLSHDLKSRGISVGILHPGLVQTPMTDFVASGITPEESVNGLLARIDGLNLKNTGTFWHANGEVLPW
jgi:NAD(P)-dependent dehydrogenase (short-subunit alcohol dehydrogenase family)